MSHFQNKWVVERTLLFSILSLLILFFSKFKIILILMKTAYMSVSPNKARDRYFNYN